MWRQFHHKPSIPGSSDSYQQLTKSIAHTLSRPSSASNPPRAVSLCKMSFPSELYFEELSIPKRRPQSATSIRSGRPSSATYKASKFPSPSVNLQSTLLYNYF